MSGQFGFQTTDPLPPLRGRVTRRSFADRLRWAREVLKDPAASAIAASGIPIDFGQPPSTLPRDWKLL